MNANRLSCQEYRGAAQRAARPHVRPAGRRRIPGGPGHLVAGGRVRGPAAARGPGLAGPGPGRRARSARDPRRRADQPGRRAASSPAGRAAPRARTRPWPGPPSPTWPGPAWSASTPPARSVPCGSTAACRPRCAPTCRPLTPIRSSSPPRTRWSRPGRNRGAAAAAGRSWSRPCATARCACAWRARSARRRAAAARRVATARRAPRLAWRPGPTHCGSPRPIRCCSGWA